MLHARGDGRGVVSIFTLHLQSATQYERVDDVASFVGRDRTGSFGVLAGHARMMTVLVFGLARFRASDGAWEYLALPGALLYMEDNQLTLNTRRYLRGDDAAQMSDALAAQLLVEEEGLRTIKGSLHQMEETLLKHLWRMKRVGEA